LEIIPPNYECRDAKCKAGFLFSNISRPHRPSERIRIPTHRKSVCPGATRDRAGNAASFWKEASFVIPSEVEESLAIQEIIRDVSTSLDMTEMRGKNTAEGSGSHLREPKAMGPDPPLIN
jgi:hypothetical protein